MKTERIDVLLAERGLVGSRTRAAQEVRAGRVRVGPDGPFAAKPSERVPRDAELILEPGRSHVSRGGQKLEHAVRELGVSLAGRDCLDVGASTGGFTEQLLRAGARRVIAVDVAYGQLDRGLRDDPRVHVLERVNARHLTPEQLPFAPQLATIDVSFISLRTVLGAVTGCLRSPGEVLAMVKPQFELGRERVGKGGVVRSAAARREAIVAVAKSARELGYGTVGLASSGLPGPKGNREAFLRLVEGAAGIGDLEAAALEVEPDPDHDGVAA